jgi:DNA polymerase III epsilon subunit-like protein
MKISNYYAVDVETSGLDPKESSILSIGAVAMDSGAKFYEECKPWDGAYISETALKINGFTKEGFAKQKKNEAQIIAKFFQWLGESPLMVAHNGYFDWGFIDAAAKRADLKNPFNYRIIDIHSITQAHMLQARVDVPSKLGLNQCLEYFGLPKEPKPHNALTGAHCNADILNKFIYGRT